MPGTVMKVCPLRSLGELSGDVLRAMRDRPFWREAAAQADSNPSKAEVNRSNLETNAPIPSEDQARTLLDAAFFASMLDEEGRRVTFTLAFVGPAAVVGSKDLQGLVFAKPIELNPKNLAKLAPSTRADVTYIGVAPNSLGELEIWGLVHRGDRTFGVDLDFSPWCFLLRVHRAGTLSANYFGTTFFLYAKGALQFIASADVQGQLRDRFDVDPVVAQVLRRLSLRVLQHGHGGALLVVRHGTIPNRLGFHVSYKPQDGPSSILKQAVDEYEADVGGGRPVPTSSQKAVHERYARERRYADALALVANLTAVDGATVVDDELNLLGFGAIVQASDAPECIHVHVEDAYTGRESVTSVGDYPGTRHRSAIQFCASQPDGSLALAFVASQDGQLSVFAKASEANTVIAIRAFELGIGI